MRLFVAAWPPPEVTEVLAAIERPAVEGVRWTAPAQWHVTLRFLGEVPEDALEDVLSSLREVAAGLSPALVVLGDRLEAFGPSVLHVPMTGFDAWAAGVARVGGEAGERGPGPFIGHVTLARGRRGRGPARGDVRPLVGKALPPGPRRWVAGSLTLVRSHLGHDGARYETLATLATGSTADHPHTNVRSQLR